MDVYFLYGVHLNKTCMTIDGLFLKNTPLYVNATIKPWYWFYTTGHRTKW